MNIAKKGKLNMSKSIEDQVEIYEKLFDLFLKDAPQADELKKVIFNFIRSKPFNDLIDFIAKWIVSMIYPKPIHLKKFPKSEVEAIDNNKEE